MSTIKSNHNPNSDESLANLEYNKKLVKDLKNKILDFIIKFEFPDFSLLGLKFGIF